LVEVEDGIAAAAARCWTNKVWPMMALATLIGMVASSAGLLICYYANLPSGPSWAVIYGFSLLAAGPMGVATKDLRCCDEK
jgi:zinc/manganese transport system permease protein